MQTPCPTSRVCISVSNSPNPPRVSMRLCNLIHIPSRAPRNLGNLCIVKTMSTRSYHPGMIYSGTACSLETEDDFVAFYSSSGQTLSKVTQNSDWRVRTCRKIAIIFRGMWSIVHYPGARGFFLVGGDRIERRSRDGESRSGEKKTSGTNG